MQTVALIDYGSGNLRSAEKALREAARRRALDADIVVTADPDLVAKADRVFLPGVGAFASCRAGLDATGRDDLDATLREAAAAGATVMVASHELERAGALASRVVDVVGGLVRPAGGAA